MFLVSVTEDKCEGCEECVNVCPQDVFRMLDSKSDPYQSSECVFCETCVQTCPTGSITILEI